ncbi:MAG: TAXI family TRAP transporter solute-binding subunit [Alphaproteobacteria bacterium]
MKKTISVAVCAAALAATGGLAQADEAPNLPKSMVWTAYDLGSSGYAEASGIANAFQNRYGTRVRIIPSGTSIGRILPLTTGKATYGFLANGAYFAAQGTYDFAVPEWGPQDIRTVIGRLATTALATAGDIDVKEISDLKGKRIGFVKGNPSVNVKNVGFLAFGGLTTDDVQQVWFGSYNAMKTAVIAGQLDAFSSVTTSANVREIEASPRSITWPQFRPENKDGWKAMTDIISFAAPSKETKGAGITEENPAWLVGIRYPIVTTYARTSEDEVYNMIKAMDVAFPDYKNTTASSENWAVEKAGRPPYDSPAHDGTIRYMKEKGWWSAEDQAWQDKRLAQLNAALEAWDEARGSFEQMRAEAQAKGEKIGDDKWADSWEKARCEKLN